MLQSRASAPAARLCAPARRSPPGGGPSREPAHRVPAAAADAASSPELPGPGSPPAPAAPARRPRSFPKLPPTPPPSAPIAKRKGAESLLTSSVQGPDPDGNFYLGIRHVGGARSAPRRPLHARPPSAAAAAPP